MASMALRFLLQRSQPAVFGMVHVRSLPGTPKSTLPVQKIIDVALQETEVYAQAGLDGIIIENMHDLPYVVGDNIGHEITASMSAICSSVKSKFPDLPVGVQVLKAGNKQALAIAHSAGCEFIRAECFTFSHISDAGWVNAMAGDLLRYKKQISANDVMIFGDIKKKHSSHSVTSDLNITEVAEASEFFLSDGVIVTGSKTGEAADIMELQDVSSKVNIPVLVGSGVTTENLENYMQVNGLIIGSYFKHGGSWCNEIDPSKVKEFMRKLHSLQGK